MTLNEYVKKYKLKVDVYQWVCCITNWDNLIRCKNFYSKQYGRKQYIDAIWVIRQEEQEDRNKQRLESFNAKVRLYSQ